MKALKIFFFIVVYLTFIVEVNAQIGEGGTPSSFGNSSCVSQSSVHCIHFPTLDNNSLLIADSLAHLNDSTKSFNFGITLQANYGINNAGTWEYLPDSSRLWRLNLISLNAYSNYLIFDSFFIPPGAKLFAYNNDQSQILGAFTSKNNKPDGRFSLGPIIGNSVTLEYYEPPKVDTLPSINVIAFIHSYKNIYKTHIDGFNSSGACNINVRCPEGDGWCNQRRSVALIARLSPVPGHYAAHCSGALITNERRDSRPYFLTANHCIDGFSVSDFIFIFNYQSQDCSTPATAPPTTFSISGATVRANHSNSDFALLELSSRPPGNYNTFYAGWTNENVRPEKNGRGIHHPSGDIKKISIYDNKPTRNNWQGAKTWRLNKWEKGTTEGGSSGSPLFNPGGLVVGQLYGGLAACGNNKSDYYGRFSVSWDDKSGASSQLRPWLSPNSTSSFFIQSMDEGDEPCKPSYFFQNANDLHTSANIDGLNNSASAGTRTYNGVYTAVGSIETGANVTIQSGTSVEFQAGTIILGLGFHAEAGSNFIATPQPCLEGCNTGVGKKGGDIANNKPFITLNTDNPKHEEESKEEDDENELQAIIVSENIQIYPNPNAGKFEIVFSDDISEHSKIIIYDIAGKQIYEQDNNITQRKIIIDISSYQKGIYIVKLILSNGVYTKKITVQ